MNIELNTPRTLSHRQDYINEITAKRTWTAVRLFEEVEGWRPGKILQSKLIYEEICNLTRDIVENKRRIDQWKASQAKSKDEEAQKLARMINRWTEYTNSLVNLRRYLQNYCAH